MGIKMSRIMGREVLKRTSLKVLVFFIFFGLWGSYDATRSAHAISLSERKIPVLKFMTNPEAYDAAMWATVDMLISTWKKELGVTFEKEVVDHDILLSKGVFGGDYDVLIAEMTGGPTRLDPSALFQACYYAECPDYYVRIPRTQCPGGGGPVNMSGYYNPEFNNLLRKQRGLFDFNERKRVLQEMDLMLVRDVPVIILLQPYVVHLMNTTNWKNEKHMVGEGLAADWNIMGIEPTGKDKTKTLRAGSNYTVSTINPLKATTMQDARPLNLIYDKLYRIDLEGKPVKWMVTEAQVLKGPMGPNTTILLKLRHDLRFHDGVPVTAEDVKYTIDIGKQFKSPAWYGYLTAIDSVELVDKYSLKINLYEPWAGIFHVLFTTIYVLPKHIWEKVAKEEANPCLWANPKPIGSGPFKFESWERGAEMVLNKNKDYFHPVNPERLVRIRFESKELLASAIERNEIDIQWGEPMTGVILKRAENTKNVKVVRLPNMAHLLVSMRVPKAPFNDLVFRKALELCTPREKIMERIYTGISVRSVSCVTPGNKTYFNPKTFDVAGKFDPEKARQILKKAGYEWDDQGNLCYP
jgi:peptide/nickel transport system substrate-binding protein